MFLAVFVVHVRSSVITSYDSRWSIHTAMSLIREGDTDLDEYEDLVRAAGYLTTERVGDHLYTVVPIAASLLAVPFVFVMDQVSGRLLGEDLDQRLRREPALHERIERFVASVIVALTAALVYLVARLELDRTSPALLVTGAFAFGTSAWSTASRALWQHGPSMLALTVALYLLVLARVRPRVIAYAGLSSYVARPTNAVSVLLLTCFVLRRYRPYALRYLLWAGVVAAPFVAFNVAVYGHPLPPYYREVRMGPPAQFIEALAGHLVSPSRGLFIFSPVLLLSVAGAVSRLKRRADELDVWVAGIVVLHWLLISTWAVWWGGHSYGPRLFTDMTPYLVYFLGAALGWLWILRGGRRIAYAGLLAVSLAASVWIHYRAATSRYPGLWNGQPGSVSV